MRRQLLPITLTIAVIATVFYLGEVSSYGFGGLPEKAALREVHGSYIAPGSDAFIKVAVTRDSGTEARLFTLYPRTASCDALQRGEHLNLLVNSVGVVIQIEGAASGMRWSYEQERRRHQCVLSLSALAGVLALLGSGLLVLIRRTG